MKGRAPYTAGPLTGVGTQSVPNTNPTMPNVLQASPVSPTVTQIR